jgi:hypothetical protein
MGTAGDGIEKHEQFLEDTKDLLHPNHYQVRRLLSQHSVRFPFCPIPLKHTTNKQMNSKQSSSLYFWISFSFLNQIISTYTVDIKNKISTMFMKY